MTDPQLLDLFTRTLRDLLGDESISLTPGMVRADVPGWDSFAYVNFIAAVELALDIRFGVADVESFRTVSEIVTTARSLLGEC